MSKTASRTADAFTHEGADANRDQRRAYDALTLPDGVHLTVHLVAQAHLDLIWYWPLADTMEMAFGLFDEALAQLDRHPEARFMQGQILLYRLLRDTDPATFERVRRYVGDGRWTVNGGQMVEPDHNMPGPEAMARQFLYGQRLARALFGKPCTHLANQDSFGHNRNLPQILKLAGIRGFLFKRPRPRYVTLTDVPFWWEGLDGTRVLAKRSNNKGIGVPGTELPLPEGVSNLQQLVDWHLETGVTQFYAPIGKSDTGGLNPFVPGAEGERWTMKQSSPGDYLEAVREEAGDRLPVHTGHLNVVYPGCYTTRLAEKEDTHRAEEALLYVEALSALSRAAGHPPQAAELEEVWWRLGFAHFHDCLTGTGSDLTHGFSRHNYAQVFFDAHRLTRRNERYLISRIAADGPGLPVVVFNPLAWERGGPVVLDLPTDRIPENFVLEDDAGRVSLCEPIDRRAFQQYGRTRAHALAAPVRGCGYRTFWIRERRPDDTVGHADPEHTVDETTVQNRHLALRIDERGRCVSLVRRASGREFLDGDGTAWEVWPETDYVYDYGSPMKPWSLGITDRFIALDQHSLKRIERVDGPLRKGLRVVYGYCDSEFEMTYLLLPDAPYVLLEARLDWHERERLLRFRVPPRLPADAEARYEIAFGSDVADKTEKELAAQNWVALHTEEAGLALYNNGRYGHTFRDNCLRISAARCAVGETEGITDEGTFRFEMQLVPFEGDLATVDVPRAAWAFRHPLHARAVTHKTGDGPAAAGLLEVAGDGVIVTGIKEAEDGDGLIVRLVETLGRATTARITVGELARVASACETNLLEDDLAPVELTALGALPLRPYEIKTLRLRLG